MKDPIKLKFLQWNCKIVFGQYGNRRIAISLVSDDELEEPIATASVNLVDEILDKNQVAIKDYSENEGMLDVMIAAGVVSKPIRFTGSGWISNIPICELLVNPEDYE